MKKIIIALSLLFLPLFASASIDANLYYGVHNKPEVTELQEFLISKNLLTGNATGNFYSLTLAAVKQYQASMGISKTGYVGTLTRKAINDELAAQLSDSNQESIDETGSLPVVQPEVTPTPAPVIIQAPVPATPQDTYPPTVRLVIPAGSIHGRFYEPVDIAQDYGIMPKGNPLQGQLGDGAWLDRLEFFMDSNLIGSISYGSGGGQMEIDTLKYANGIHTLSVRAYDMAGNTGNDSGQVDIEN